MRTASESFLLLHPDVRKNSHEVARRIAACRGVRKVIITSGDFGFVVSVAEDGELGSEEVARRVKTSFGSSRVSSAKGHYVYLCAPATQK